MTEYEAALKNLVADIRDNQPDTWLYTVMQDSKNPHSFTHYAIYRDDKARAVHHNPAVTRAKNIIKDYLQGGFKATIFNVVASQSVLSKPTEISSESATAFAVAQHEPF